MIQKSEVCKLQRLLVIRRDNIGDLVCTTPLLAALRVMLPQAHIGVLVNSYNAPVLAGNPDVDAVYAYTKLKHRDQGQSLLHAMWLRWCFLRRLRRARYDTAILARADFDRHGLRFARQLGIRHVIGFAPASGADGLAARGLSVALPPPDRAHLHHVECLVPLLQALGPSPAPGALRVVPDAARLQKLRDGLLSVGKHYVAVHISARETSRRLGEDKWIKLLKGLVRREPACHVMLFWSPGNAEDPRHPGDDKLAERIANACRDEADSFSLCPTLALNDLIAQLALCHSFIGADGGAMHLAAALRLPCVALFENLPSKYLHWYPWKTRHELVVSPGLAIAEIDPHRIVDAWVRLVGSA